MVKHSEHKARYKVFVAGHNGMVGSAIVRKLNALGYEKIITRSRSELDLTDQSQVTAFFEKERLDQVYLAAAKVGGIHANNEYPADFIYQNLAIQANIIGAAHKTNVQNLLFLGSSCIYPKFAQQPMTEDMLMTGTLEPTNEPYAVAKIAGIKLCESFNRQYNRDYRCVMPTNLYGQNDYFHPENAHVVPALIGRFHKAKVSGEKEVVIWGSGNPKREFLHVDDMASACVYVMNLAENVYKEATSPMSSHVNIGTGEDCTIGSLAEKIADVTEYRGKLVFDQSKPDGAPRKLLSVSKIHGLGWRHEIELEEGLRKTYQWYLQNQNQIRK
jgi:GDP-L-fucose synthase